jgi:heat shock protein HslJ
MVAPGVCRRPSCNDIMAQWTMTKLLLASSFAVAALILGACTATRPAGKVPPLTPEIMTTIGGIEWKLGRWNAGGGAVALAPGAEVTLVLGKTGTVEGRGPVNRYFGSFKLGADGRIDWSAPGFGTTRMAGPPELMDQESAFLRDLAQTTRCHAAISALIFRTENGSVELEFTR